ncbi:MAG: IS982 family transposase, partial [Planctomycetota bacterium]
MSSSELNQDYIESLAQSMRAGEKLEFAQLCELLFAIIDVFCAHLPQRSGPGRRQTYSDNTILKIDMLMHLTGKTGETEILREIDRHYRAYFDKVPDQSRLWHRIHEALPLIEQLRCALRDQLGVAYEDLRVLDSMPIPVAVPNSRPGRGNGFDLADGGYCASKKLKYRGFKLGMLITDHGIPDTYDLFSARPHDVQLLDDLLGDSADILALGDKGFISDPKSAQLEREQGVLLITYRRKNQKQQNTPLEKWVLRQYRQLIETIFSQLDGHMHIQHTGAKTDIGL